jgi:hypothetical protein
MLAFSAEKFTDRNAPMSFDFLQFVAVGFQAKSLKFKTCSSGFCFPRPQIGGSTPPRAYSYFDPAW